MKKWIKANWVETIMLVVLGLLVAGVGQLAIKTYHRSQACEAKGGVWVSRGQICVNRDATIPMD